MELICEFAHLIYQNPDNLFTVAMYKTELEGKKKEINCSGISLPLYKIPYKFDVTEVKTGKYAGSYNVNSYKEEIGLSKNSVVSYLSCGMFKGLGPKTAQKIYDYFGEATLDIFNENMDELKKVKGITQKTVDKIRKSYNENYKYRELSQFLMPYGFSMKQIMKVGDKVGEMTFIDKTVVEAIKDNPYLMCFADGVTFNHAELLRKDLDIPLDASIRINASAREVIKKNLSTGTVGIKKQQLINGMKKILGLKKPEKEVQQLIWNQILQMIHYEKLGYRKVKHCDEVITYFYLPEYLKVEKELGKYIAKKVHKTTKLPKNMDELIDKFSGKIRLDESQRNAVKSAFSNKLSVITGGPGTGKTTIVKIISDIYNYLYTNNEQTFLAPTGKAARRLTESTSKPANTIHAKFTLQVHDGDSEYTEDRATIDNGLVIIDEFSMVDMMLAHLLFRSVMDECTVVIVGDANQLMSVGAGSVLHDIIKSKCVPVARLQFAHRQSSDSVIPLNADLIQKDEVNLQTNNDFQIIKMEKKGNTEEYLQKMEDYMVKATVLAVQRYGIENVACLCPYKKYQTGVISMNKRLQEALNPNKDERLEMKLIGDMYARRGDVVMHLQNSDTVLNGDVGIVKDVYPDDDGVMTMLVFYTGPTGQIIEKEYTKDNIEEVTLAYAITVHKSQGSEYQAIITCLTDFHRFAKKRNLIYTAITRAKKQVYLFCNEEALAEAIHNDAVEERNSLLDFSIMENLGRYYEYETIANARDTVEKQREKESIEKDPKRIAMIEDFKEYLRCLVDATEERKEALLESFKKDPSSVWQQQTLPI